MSTKPSTAIFQANDGFNLIISVWQIGHVQHTQQYAKVFQRMVPNTCSPECVNPPELVCN